MTKDEFIDQYITNSRKHYPNLERTVDGFKVGKYHRIALPCVCGDESCRGWAMVSEEFIEDHMRLYAPNPKD